MSNAADNIRAALKTAGFNARAVTVRQTGGGGIRVTVRSADVSLSEIAAIAKLHEVVRRDHASGEILCGGNTFVDVSYEPAVVAPYIAAVVARLEAAPERTVVEIGRHRAFWSGSRFDIEVSTFTETLEGRDIHAHGMHHGAERIAVDLLSRHEGAELLVPAAPAVEAVA